MDFLHDIRFTLRQLGKNPGFAAVVILTLTLGIGANTSIFSVVNAVLLTPLPIADADEVVIVSETVRREITEMRAVSYPDFLDWREQNTVFEDIVAFYGVSFTLTGTDGASRIQGELVSGSYFDLLAIEPRFGRAFLPEEDETPDTHPVTVISHGLWQRSFGGNADIIGRTINLNDRAFTVVGVAPEAFLGMDDDTAAWVLMNMISTVFSSRFLERRGTRWHAVVARLKPGRSVDEAQAEMEAIAARLEEEYIDSNENYGAMVIPIRESIQGGLQTRLLMLLATVGSVLMIACTNVENLSLERMTSREREPAVRAAMAAGRARLLRQFLTESVVLISLGGLLGILIALWTVEALKILSPVSRPSFVDISVLLFTSLVALITGLGVGAMAASQGSRPDVNEALKSGGRASARMAQQRLRIFLVVSEVGLALLLLSGAGLMISSFSQMRDIDLGFEAENLTTLRIALPAAGYANDQVWPVEEQLLERVASLPSVMSAALTSDIPLEGASSATIVTPEDYPPDLDRGVRIYRHSVSPGFFETAEMPLLRGRIFDSRDVSGSAISVIATETFVRRLWDDEDPIGKRIKCGDPDSGSA